MTGQNVLLTKEDTKMIQQIYGKKHPTAAGEDLYAVCSLFDLIGYIVFSGALSK